MTETPYENGIKFRVGALERRTDKLESYEPAVLVERIDQLGKEFRAMKNAAYVLTGSLIVAAVGFAFTVLAQKGG